MSDEPQRTYSAREIVLEFFPATHERLIPSSQDYRLERRGEGSLAIRHLPTSRELVLTPISPAGNAVTQVLCDLCSRSAPRYDLQMFRLTLPGSGGRRFRYLSLCRDTEACELHRPNDAALVGILTRAFGR